MKHPERIEDYLEHIAEAVDRITAFLHGIDSADALERDLKTQAAVIRYVEIIGEAANQIQRQAPELIAAHASLPWHEMRAMRNRMIHNYFDVNTDVLWRTVTDDLPELRRRIYDLLIELKGLQGPG